MAGALKKTTGLMGLAVCETPHERLRILYTKILDVLDQIPKSAAYRKYTEQITNERLAIVKAEPDVKKLEDRLQLGQVEEVILQVKEEFNIAVFDVKCSFFCRSTKLLFQEEMKTELTF
ncbi:NADH dehydrogenase [ubiquinone] 1 alpha subcomplex subunit 5 [Octodon degus]|uniref:NADH dehydrogenase [ubiquinone] 1 alpha subcomplex subunit 5 n=1 Tax=Octodon degus TaxID=10160 RepID=A0A6P3FRW2_OCTDE|nr:NADH dehydrogenase [ubiquinone] 1 alpha subcomplex subunit 5 [Octodon degus]